MWKYRDLPTDVTFFHYKFSEVFTRVNSSEWRKRTCKRGKHKMMPCLNITCKCSMIKLLNLSENQQKSMWTSTKDQFVRKLSRLKSNDLVTHTDSSGYNVHRAFELLSFYLKKYDIYNVIYLGLCMLGLTDVKLRYPQTHVARILSIINNSMALRKSETWKTYS